MRVFGPKKDLLLLKTIGEYLFGQSQTVSYCPSFAIVVITESDLQSSGKRLCSETSLRSVRIRGNQRRFVKHCASSDALMIRDAMIMFQMTAAVVAKPLYRKTTPSTNLGE